MSEKSYAKRTQKAVRAKFDKVTADVQKFRAAICLICTSNPTGVTQDEVMSMAIPKHLGKRDGISHDAHSFANCNSKNHLAHKLLCVYPKLSDDGTFFGMALLGSPQPQLL